MSEIFGDKGWQIVKIGAGVLLVLLAMALPFILEPAESARRADLEDKGVQAIANVTSVEESHIQAPRGKSAVGSYVGVRRLGGSRKLALGAALIQRSANRSAQHAAANGPSYFDIEYEFPFGEGFITGSDRLKLPHEDAIKAGAELTLLYDPRDPSIHRLTDYSVPAHHISPALKYGLPVLIGLLGAFLLWWGMQDGESTATASYADAAAAAYAAAPRMAMAPAARKSSPTVAPRQPVFAKAPTPGVAPARQVTAAPAASRLDLALRGNRTARA